MGNSNIFKLKTCSPQFTNHTTVDKPSMESPAATVDNHSPLPQPILSSMQEQQIGVNGNANEKKKRKKKRTNKSNQGEIACDEENASVHEKMKANVNEELNGDVNVNVNVHEKEKEEEHGNGDLNEKKKKKKTKKISKNNGESDSGVLVLKKKQQQQQQENSDESNIKKRRQEEEEEVFPEVPNPKKAKLCESIFTLDDEIAILKGLSELVKKNIEPIAKYLTLSLSVQTNSRQLNGKVNKLKRRYLESAKKGRRYLANDPTGEKFTLSQKVWQSYLDDGVGFSCKCCDEDAINVTSLAQLLELLEDDGLCGALHAKLEEDKLMHYIEGHMYRLTNAQRHTASFLAELKKKQK